MGKKNKVVKLTDRKIRYIIKFTHGKHIPHNAIHKERVYVCVVLDDRSRRILAGGKFDAETTDNVLQLLKEAMDRFGWLTSIRQVLTDRGTQFYANKRDKNGDADRISFGTTDAAGPRGDERHL